MKLLNSKYKKYILKFEELGDKLKIINTNNEYKIVDNTIQNKIKVMETIKKHKEEIDKRINYYENKKEDYKLVIMSSSMILIFLGCLFGLSFFFGSYLLMFTTFIAFNFSLYLYSINTYKILLFRSEIKRLDCIVNKKVKVTNEIFDIIKDSFIVLKDKFYKYLIKTIDFIDNRKVKNN